MNNKYLSTFVLPLLLMIAGCDLGVKQEYETSDAELVQMIIDADKVDIDISELPEQSQTYLNNDKEYDELGSRYASQLGYCLLYTSPSPRDYTRSRMPSSA